MSMVTCLHRVAWIEEFTLRFHWISTVFRSKPGLEALFNGFFPWIATTEDS